MQHFRDIGATKIAIITRLIGMLKGSMPADFSKNQVKVERRGDTVWLGFKEPSSSGNNILYNITVDIDSYPRYKFLGIDDEAYQIVYSN